MRSRLLACRSGIVAAAFAVALASATTLGWGQAPERAPAERTALLAAIEGPIGPATLRHVEKVIEAARDRQSEVLVLRLHTPGGLATSMREIVSEILASPVPVVGYVAPSGAHAASAGTYILYATHVAAMAPGTNLGAATPVQIGGTPPGLPSGDGRRPDAGKRPPEDAPKDGPKEAPDRGSGGAMETKAVNDAVAFIRSLAELHGRNADWAEKAVREGASLSARRALDQGVIDLMADDVDALLRQIDGRTVTAGSTQRTLATAGAAVERMEPGVVTRLLGLLSNPNVALVLLMIGIYGLIFEFASPGSIGPGVVGAICLVLGFYALHQLPLDYAGLALVLLGVAFMVAEAITPTFGALGIGGLIAFVVGAAMLIDTDVPAYQLSWWTIGAVAAVSAAVIVLLIGYLWRVHRRAPSTDEAGLLGAEAEVIDWSDGEGRVRLHGERWFARGDPSLTEGQSVRVRAVDGLTLEVERPPEPG